MAPKMPSVKGLDKPPELVVEPPLPDLFYQKHPDAKPTFDEQWFDDPVDSLIRIVIVTEKSSMYILMKTPMLPLRELGCYFIFKFGLILYGIPKPTSQELEGPRRILLSKGEEAIRLAVALHKKIEEKAVPVRTWLERNIVPLLLQALTALVAKRPSNPCEFMAAHLLKYNPLKDKYPEDECKPPKIIEEMCEEPEDEDDPCGCKQFLTKDCADDKAATVAAATTAAEKKAKEIAHRDPKQLAKKSTIAADARKSVTVPDAVRESMVQALSKKKSIK